MGELRARGVSHRGQPRDLRPRAPDPAPPPRAGGDGGGGARRAARSAPRCAASAPPTRTRPGGAACAWATCCGRRPCRTSCEEARRQLRGGLPRRAARSRRWTGTRSLRDLAGFGERLRPAHHGHSLVLQRQIAQRLLDPVRGRAGHAARHRPRHVSVRDLVVGGGGRRAHRPRRPAHARRRHAGHRQGLHHARGRGPAALRDRRRRSRTRSASGAASSAPPPAGRGAAAGSTPWSCATRVRVNGFDSLALTKLDVLDELAGDQGLHRLPLRGRDARRSSRPTSSLLEGMRARLRDAARAGDSSTAGVRDFAMLPPAARRYVERLSELVGLRDRDRLHRPRPRRDTILRAQSAVASWFD